MLHEVSSLFVSQGVPLNGRIYRTHDAARERQPAVIVTGSWLTVQQQMPALYARLLAARGLTAFTFDFAGWGASGGALRCAELPLCKVEDIRSAAHYLAAQSFVDPERIALLSVCASAQYALRALLTDAPIKAFASVAGWFHDAATVAPFYGGESGVARRIERATRALERFAGSGELSYVPAYAPGDDRAGMHFELDYYGNPERGAVASWPNRMAELSWLHWLSYDGLTPAARVQTPTLLVHSDGCALPDNARRVHAALAGPKALAWLDGTQTDYYDQPPQLSAAVERATAFFMEAM